MFGKSATYAIAISGLVLQSLADVAASPCSSLQVPDSANDGDLFYSAKSGGWQRYQSYSSLALTSPQTVEFVYVVKPPVNRAGVVVIKTGRNANDSVPPSGNQQSILLIRNENAVRFTNVCHARRHRNKENLPFPIAGRTISSKSYDDFHDWTGRVPPSQDFATLDAFHIAYEGAPAQPGGAGTCQETDDRLPPDDTNPNNRSQFSFSPNIVSDGQHWGISDAFLSWAFADGSTGLANQRVEIRRYKMSPEDGAACVVFHVTVAGPNYFVRVNDLEARLGNYRLRVEHSW